MSKPQPKTASNTASKGDTNAEKKPTQAVKTNPAQTQSKALELAQEKRDKEDKVKVRIIESTFGNGGEFLEEGKTVALPKSEAGKLVLAKRAVQIGEGGHDIDYFANIKQDKNKDGIIDETDDKLAEEEGASTAANSNKFDDKGRIVSQR